MGGRIKLIKKAKQTASPAAPAANQGSPAPATDDNHLVIALGTPMAEVEKLVILKTLEANADNKTKTADILGISIRTLRNKLNEFKGE